MWPVRLRRSASRGHDVKAGIPKVAPQSSSYASATQAPSHIPRMNRSGCSARGPSRMFGHPSRAKSALGVLVAAEAAARGHQQ